jgi:hypothetical protein
LGRGWPTNLQRGTLGALWAPWRSLKLLIKNHFIPPASSQAGPHKPHRPGYRRRSCFAWVPWPPRPPRPPRCSAFHWTVRRSAGRVRRFAERVGASSLSMAGGPRRPKGALDPPRWPGLTGVPGVGACPTLGVPLDGWPTNPQRGTLGFGGATPPHPLWAPWAGGGQRTPRVPLWGIFDNP